jgi:hypothetical protein
MPSEVDRYPVNPLDPSARLAEKIEGLERRIRELEGQRFVGSNLIMKDTNGDVRARIGELIGAGGAGTRWGFEGVFQPGDANWVGGYPFLRVSDDGAEFPYAINAWADATVAKSITSGSFVNSGLESSIGLVSHVCVATEIRIVTPVGTTGEIRIANASTGTFSPAVSIPSNTNAYIAIPAWHHGAQLWTGPILFPPAGAPARR